MSLDSELLAQPADLAVDERGDVFVLDAQLACIVVLSESDSAVVLGNEGAGPGEFNLPSALDVSLDTIRVVDSGNGRVQILQRDGAYVRSYPMPGNVFGGTAIHRDGRLAVPTQGFRTEVLARTFDPEGQPLDSVGRTVAPSVELWDILAIKDQIAEGQVPNALRNMAKATFDAAGALWLVLNAEGLVQRYDTSGALLGSYRMEAPELDRILHAFFESNREIADAPAFRALSYVADVYAVGDALWLLLYLPEDEASVVLVIALDGTPRQRVVVPTARGARQLAFDPRSRTLYLAVPSEASLIAVPLPR